MTPSGLIFNRTILTILACLTLTCVITITFNWEQFLK